jgi:5'-3' exonuclease
MKGKYQAYFNEIKLKGEGAVDENTKDSRVLVVDGLNTFIRAYAASPTTNINGEHIGGISGFLLSVGHAIKAINPTRVIVVFDGKDGSAKRRQLFPEYKAHRKFKIRLNRAETVDKEDNQREQLMRLVEYLDVLPFSVIVSDGVEADDVIAYIAEDYMKERASQVFIMSSDKDFMQLVNERIHIWSPTKKQLYYTNDVYEQFGFMPHNFALYRALMGDDSDNIPGITGLGTKTILSRLPKVAEKELMTVDQFVEYVKELRGEHPKVKLYSKVLEQEKELRLYHQIMQLSESGIPGHTKLKIIDQLGTKVDRLAKIKFHQMLYEDGMTNAIKNVEMWVKEVTQKLDQFALQD